MTKNLDDGQLLAGLAHILESPADGGALLQIVRRPESGLREVVKQAQLDVSEGLVGDNWKARGSTRTEDGAAHPGMQLTMMNARAADLVAQEVSRWALAGDQLFVDMDLSQANLPPGSQLMLGEALIEVTAVPHLGCKKFVERFGAAAMKLVNSAQGRALRLRGLNARVVHGGAIQIGNAVHKHVLP